jgi:hypothetical protein
LSICLFYDLFSVGYGEDFILQVFVFFFARRLRVRDHLSSLVIARLFPRPRVP